MSLNSRDNDIDNNRSADIHTSKDGDGWPPFTFIQHAEYTPCAQLCFVDEKAETPGSESVTCELKQSGSRLEPLH